MTATVAAPEATAPSSHAHTVPDEARIERLRRFNLLMGLLHLLSGAVMLALANDFTLPVSSLGMNGPPGTPLADASLNELWAVPLGVATAGFLLLSALFHLIVASPVGFPAYRAELLAGRNRFRWVEYSLSATLMIVLIALVSGLTDLAALIGIAFANVAMILFGWVMEVANPRDRERTWWAPFWFGCIAGAGPWVAISGYLAVNLAQPGAASPPTFVYGILVTIFVLFNCFAVNQWLQYRGRGRWADPLRAEVTYIVLSLVAKSLLAWQIFANTLIE